MRSADQNQLAYHRMINRLRNIPPPINRSKGTHLTINLPKDIQEW